MRICLKFESIERIAEKEVLFQRNNNNVHKKQCTNELGTSLRQNLVHSSLRVNDAKEGSPFGRFWCLVPVVG